MTTLLTFYLLILTPFFTLCTDLYNNHTIRQAGYVFVPHYNSNRYGRQSVKLSCIFNWNHLSEVLNQNLLSLIKGSFIFNVGCMDRVEFLNLQFFSYPYKKLPKTFVPIHFFSKIFHTHT